MTPPARGALNPPPRDRTELPRPRLQRPMPIARDPEVLASEDPATGIDDRRSQGLLVRINPDNVARMIGRDQHMRGPRTALLRSCHHLTSRRNVVADRPTTSRWTHPFIGGANASIRSGRSSKARTEADTSSERHPSPGSQIALWVRPRFNLRPYANRRPRRAPKIQHRDRSSAMRSSREWRGSGGGALRRLGDTGSHVEGLAMADGVARA